VPKQATTPEALPGGTLQAAPQPAVTHETLDPQEADRADP
jgi:hypothetical protein